MPFLTMGPNSTSDGASHQHPLRVGRECMCAAGRGGGPSQLNVLGFCWPIRGEFDVRDIARQDLAAGGQVALPVVVQKSAPVEFWNWRPGTPMETGIWGNRLCVELVLVLETIGLSFGDGQQCTERVLLCQAIAACSGSGREACRHSSFSGCVGHHRCGAVAVGFGLSRSIQFARDPRLS